MSAFLRGRPSYTKVSRLLNLRTFAKNVAKLEDKSQGYEAKKKSLISPTLWLVGFIPVCTLGLGIWQIQRLKWKINLIDELEEKLHSSPLPLPGRVNLSAIPEFAYRRVILHGRWDHAHPVLVGPRVHDNVHGFHVITPLIRPDGSTILVNRGFVSQDFKDAITSPKQSNEEVTVYGMIKEAPERTSYFQPDNNPTKSEWYWPDVQALADHAGGGAANVQPLLVEEVFAGHLGEAKERVNSGIPLGRPASVELRNMHATYAVTWFSLSAFTSFMFFHFWRRRSKAPAAQMPRR